ncbi:lamin-C-like [Rhodnius prolixus]
MISSKATTKKSSSQSKKQTLTVRASGSSRDRSPTPPTRRSATPSSALSATTTSEIIVDSKKEQTSAVSPEVTLRKNEKEELATLNDRLACYIDRVRYLETENAKLSREVRTSQETISREVTSVKTIYDRELSEARKLVDELSNEKAKLEIDAKRLFAENSDLRECLEKKNNDCSLLESDLAISENRLSAIQTKHNDLVAENKKLRDAVKKLEDEKQQLAGQVAKLRKNLELETYVRIEHENALQTAREEMAFKEQVHQQEVSEHRTKKEVEISEIDGRLSQQYEQKLYESLQDIRDQYEADLECNKDQIKRLYDEKIITLESQLSRRNNMLTTFSKEIEQMQTKVDDLKKRLADEEGLKNMANQRVRDLEMQVERLKSQYMDELASHNSEMTRLREQMARHAQDHQELMDTKISLDLEIATYRKLLESEEARLNITPSPSFSAPPTPRRPRVTKRKRTFREESEDTSTSNYCVNSTSKGDIEFAQVDAEGKVVRLVNRGGKEVSLAGYKIVRQAGDNPVVTYKCHRTLKIDAGSTVTVWSADTTDQAHEPPANLVMKGQNWPVADNMTTTLIDSNGEEMASIRHTKIQSSSSTSRQTESLGAGPSSVDSIGGYFHRRSPSKRMRSSEVSQGEERCSIM